MKRLALAVVVALLAAAPAHAGGLPDGPYSAYFDLLVNTGLATPGTSHVYGSTPRCEPTWRRAGRPFEWRCPILLHVPGAWLLFEARVTAHEAQITGGRRYTSNPWRRTGAAR